MQLNNFEIFGVACGIGAEESGAELGVWDIYSHISKLHPTLEFKKIFHEASHFTKLDVIPILKNLFSSLNTYILEKASSKKKHLFLSGDHSAGFGIWSALSNLHQKDLGLIWIDAHLDCHTPQTSPSGNVHGMPVAHLLGHGDRRLTNLIQNKFKPENICYIGIRDYESEELAFVKKHNIKVHFMENISKDNFNELFQDAVQHVTQNTEKFGVSLDIDNFDPSEAPGTGCYNPNGLWVDEMANNIRLAAQDNKFCGLEISEYNPLKDIENKTRTAIFKLIDAFLFSQNQFVNN